MQSIQDTNWPNKFFFFNFYFGSYFDSNNISGVLTFPFVSTTTSLLRLVSLVNNNITDLRPSTESLSLFSESSLRISDLVFLGGNPVCKDSRKSDLLRIVCRFNKSSPIEGTCHFYSIVIPQPCNPFFLISYEYVILHYYTYSLQYVQLSQILSSS